MSDYMHDYTDRQLQDLERRIRYEYAQATVETQKKVDEYFRRFEKQDARKRKQLEKGDITKEEYQKWRRNKMLVGKRWKELKDSLASDALRTNEKAHSMLDGFIPQAYADNFNYGTFEAESMSGIDTAFTLYDRDTVVRLMRDDPDLLPPPGRQTALNIAMGNAERWEKTKIQSIMMQGILQGESIPHLAKRLATGVNDTNMKAAIRNARTMTTGAENAGRRNAHERAEKMGIHIEDVWIAVHDNRTRHEHRMADQQSVKVGQPFIIDGYKLRFPGDPSAPGYLIYNCRCTVVGKLIGIDDDIDIILHNSDLKGMTYEQWKASKPVYQKKKRESN